MRGDHPPPGGRMGGREWRREREKERGVAGKQREGRQLCVASLRILTPREEGW